MIWLNTHNNYLIHLHVILPWLLSLWVSAFLFLPLEGSDCFFSGVYKQQKERDPKATLFIYIIFAKLLQNKFKSSFIKHDFTIQQGCNFISQLNNMILGQSDKYKLEKIFKEVRNNS